MLFSSKELLSFVRKAARQTYAGGGKPEEKPEQEGFIEGTIRSKLILRSPYS